MPAEIPTSAVPFATQKADGRAAVSSLENIKNAYVEISPPSSESPFALIFSPGLRAFSEITGVGRIMGAVVVRNVVYVATPKALYTVREGAFSQLGEHSLPGVRASMATNGEHIVYADGFGVWTYTIATGVLDRAKDNGGNNVGAAHTATYQDGYFLLDVKNTNQWRVSDLDSIVFNSLQFASAEGAPDFILSILSDHREVWIFKEETTEVWYNSGEDFPFTRLQGGFIEKGIAAPYTFTKANNTVYWVGHDGLVYQAAGYQPDPISSSSIEEAIAGVDMSDAWMDTYTQEGHIFIWLTVPSIEATFVFDTTTGLWAERTNLTDKRHRANVLISIQNRTLVGDYKSGNIYEFDLDYPYDDDELIEREVTLPPLFGEGNRQRNAVFELKMQNFSNSLVQPDRTIVTGMWTADSTCVTADQTGPTADGMQPNIKECCPGLPAVDQLPQIGLKNTDNHGNTWSPYKYKPAAKKGMQTMRWRWYKLGSYFERTYRLRMVAPISGVWIGAYIG